MKKPFFLILCLVWSSISASQEGFLAGTKVKMPYGYVPIEELHEQDVVVGCAEDGVYAERPVLALSKQQISQYVKMIVGNEVVCAAPHQKFYAPEQDAWIDAQDVAPSQALQNFTAYLLIDHIEKVNQETEACALTVSGHNFCVTTHDIQVHNADTCIWMCTSRAYHWSYGT